MCPKIHFRPSLTKIYLLTSYHLILVDLGVDEGPRSDSYSIDKPRDDYWSPYSLLQVRGLFHRTFWSSINTCTTSRQERQHSFHQRWEVLRNRRRKVFRLKGFCYCLSTIHESPSDVLGEGEVRLVRVSEDDLWTPETRPYLNLRTDLKVVLVVCRQNVSREDDVWVSERHRRTGERSVPWNNWSPTK